MPDVDLPKSEHALSPKTSALVARNEKCGGNDAELCLEMS